MAGRLTTYPDDNDGIAVRKRVVAPLVRRLARTEAGELALHKSLAKLARSCFYDRVSKGEQTRETILREALAQSSHVGLHGITVGMLAEKLDMSKSGLYAHFKSKEQLQTDVLDFAAEHFRRLVFFPAMQQPRGLPRLTTLFERWLGWDGYADFALPGGCIFVTVTREFDDEPDGPVRDLIVLQQREWLNSIAVIVSGAIREGQFAPTTDPELFAHDLMGVMLGYHFAARLLRDERATERARRGFGRLVREAAAGRGADGEPILADGVSRTSTQLRQQVARPH